MTTHTRFHNIFAALALAVASCTVWADPASCSRAWDRAKEAGSEASRAFDNQYWARAIDLSDRAASLWGDTAYECSGKNKDSAYSNQQASKNNLENARNNLNQERCEPYSAPASNKFAEAKRAFESSDWTRASALYQQAQSLYLNAANICDGRSAATARDNASVAGDNSQKAMFNLNHDKCELDVSPARSKFREAGSAFDAENWKLATTLYEQAQALYLKAADRCTGRSSEVARDNAASSARNAEKARHNAGVVARNAKRTSCTALQTSAADATKAARQYEKSASYAEAARTWESAASFLKKLADECADMASDIKYAEFFEEAKLASKKLAACGPVVADGLNLYANLLTVVDKSTPLGAYAKDIQKTEDKLKEAETKCYGKYTQIVAKLRADVIMVRSDLAVCLPRLRQHVRTTGVDASTALEEAAQSCQSTLFTDKVKALSAQKPVAPNAGQSVAASPASLASAPEKTQQ
jgi:hypothetical protein